MKRKRLIIGAAAAAAVIAVGVGISGAYLISTPVGMDNDIVVGYDKTEIIEDFDPPSEQKSGAATCYKKKVTVRNTGDTPCYVRMFADFSSGFIRKISYFSYDNADSADPASKTYHSAILTMADGYFIKEVSSDANPHKGWVYIPEAQDGQIGGYYYYTEILEPGEETPPLFTYVKTDYTGTGEDVQQYDVIVYSESVQIVTKDGKSAPDAGATDRYQTVWKEYLG